MAEPLGRSYDVIMRGLALLGLERARRRLVEGVRGRVLELGVGTGLTFRHYDAGDGPAVGIDLDPSVLSRAAGRVRGRTALACADVQALPFRDGGFDTVVVSLVFCSVEDPARGLAEVRRVLRPGGELRLLEHVRSEGPRLGRWQDRLAPAWLRFTGGCRLDRRTVDAVRAAGFTIERERRPGRGLVAEIAARR